MPESEIEEDLVRTGKKVNQTHVIGSISNEIRANPSFAGYKVITEPNQTESAFQLFPQRVDKTNASGLKLTLCALEIKLVNAIDGVKASINSTEASTGSVKSTETVTNGGEPSVSRANHNVEESTAIMMRANTNFSSFPILSQKFSKILHGTSSLEKISHRSTKS